MRIRERYELAVELGWSYQQAGRKERGRILDAFCLATGYSRKHALRVLRGTQRRRWLGVRRQRKRRYSFEFQRALKILWEASGYICAERLRPFLRPLSLLLERHGQLELTPELEKQLRMVSTSTVERNLRQLRRQHRDLFERRMSQTKPATLLRHEVPVVVGQWKELDRPGYLEVDSVAHSGGGVVGQWIWTISATDISTGWTERVPVMGRTQEPVLAAMQRIRHQLPFPLLGIHPDNGHEFINRRLISWCHDEGIQISRSRPFHKNDNAHIEQKNWTLVRRLIGYQRLDMTSQLNWLDEFYTELLRPYNNCFQPVMKLVGKEHRADRQPRRRYDIPTTPLQRVLASGSADLTKVKALVELYSSVSPLTLKRQIDLRLMAMPLTRKAVNA
jgi:transposase InsO family protein